MTRFPALAHRPFRLYFIVQSIALVGGFAYNVALAWLAFRLTGSTLVLGIVGFATMAPTLFVSPIAGLFIDRYSRRQLLIGLHAVVAAHGVTMALLTVTDSMSTPVLIGLALFRGIFFACEIPVRHAFLADLVPDREVLPNAVALHSSALNAARFIGPAVGGALIAAAGEAACFLLHPLVLIAPMLQLSRIRSSDRIRTPEKTPFVRQYLEGWRLAFRDPVIARLLAGIGVMGFAVGPYTFLMPAAVAELYEPRPELVGMLLSAAGLGSALAAFTLAAWRDNRKLLLTALAGNASAGLGLLVFSLGGSVPVAIGGLWLVGFGVIFQAASTNMSIQKRVSDDQRGRVMAIYTAMFLGATPFGSLAFGKLGHWIGAANSMTVGAVITLAGAALTARRLRG